jgi:hypothetical protein
MQMRNEDVMDPASPDFEAVHLDLCAFATIHQEQLFPIGHQLGRRVPVVHGQRRVIS